MGILDKVAKLEKKIEQLAERQRVRRQPVELRRAILEEIEEHIEPAGRSRRLLPYDWLSITVEADREERAPLEALLEPSRLRQAIEEHLQQGGCEVEKGLEVSVRFVKTLPPGRAAGKPFTVVFDRRAETLRRGTEAPRRGGLASRHSMEAALLGAGGGPAGGGQRRAGDREKAAEPTGSVGSGAAGSVAQAQLVIFKGQATKKAFPLAGERTNIGRLAEVTDKDNRVVRRNQVIFLDTHDEANRTVSRAHAHVQAVSGEYRLHDDRSLHGTRIFRQGLTIDIPSGSPRGTKLQPGDELYFGQAAARFEMRAADGRRKTSSTQRQGRT